MPTLLLVVAYVIVAVALLTIPIGCTELALPDWMYEQKTLAADVTQRKAEIEELQVELAGLVQKAEADPTPENTAAVDLAKTVLNKKVRAVTVKMIDLEALTEHIKEAQAAAADAQEAVASGIEQYAPEPYRGIALTLFGGLLAAIKSHGYYAAKIKRERDVGKSVVNSLSGVLTDEQKAEIKQGPEAKALVDEAQGRV